MSATATLRQINAKSRRKFKDAAATIPSDVVAAISLRADEAIASDEKHKACAGWVILPFKGDHDLMGLLEVGSKAIREAQLKSYYND